MSVIEWTKEKRDRLEAAVQYELMNGAGRFDKFTFDGHEFVVGYAQYLLEYLDKADPE